MRSWPRTDTRELPRSAAAAAAGGVVRCFGAATVVTRWVMGRAGRCALYHRRRGEQQLDGALDPDGWVDAGGGRRCRPPNISSLSRARSRLGADPLPVLFDLRCRPGRRRGGGLVRTSRVVAMDGTTSDGLGGLRPGHRPARHPGYPALDLACAYPMRLRAETVIGHHKTDMGAGMPACPDRPDRHRHRHRGLPPHERDLAPATFHLKIINPSYFVRDRPGRASPRATKKADDFPAPNDRPSVLAVTRAPTENRSELSRAARRGPDNLTALLVIPARPVSNVCMQYCQGPVGSAHADGAP